MDELNALSLTWVSISTLFENGTSGLPKNLSSIVQFMGYQFGTCPGKEECNHPINYRVASVGFGLSRARQSINQFAHRANTLRTFRWVPPPLLSQVNKIEFDHAQAVFSRSTTDDSPILTLHDPHTLHPFIFNLQCWSSMWKNHCRLSDSTEWGRNYQCPRTRMGQQTEK